MISIQCLCASKSPNMGGTPSPLCGCVDTASRIANANPNTSGSTHRGSAPRPSRPAREVRTVASIARGKNGDAESRSHVRRASECPSSESPLRFNNVRHVPKKGLGVAELFLLRDCGSDETLERTTSAGFRD